MKTYCYRCPECDELYEKPYRGTTFVCFEHDVTLQRDYRAEAVNVAPVK